MGNLVTTCFCADGETKYRGTTIKAKVNVSHKLISKELLQQGSWQNRPHIQTHKHTHTHTRRETCERWQKFINWLMWHSHKRRRCPCSLAVSLTVLAPAWLNVRKFSSCLSFFSIMFHGDLCDQGNYLSSWVIAVKDKACRALAAADYPLRAEAQVFMPHWHDDCCLFVYPLAFDLSAKEKTSPARPRVLSAWGTAIRWMYYLIKRAKETSFVCSSIDAGAAIDLVEHVKTLSCSHQPWAGVGKTVNSWLTQPSCFHKQASQWLSGELHWTEGYIIKSISPRCFSNI